MTRGIHCGIPTLETERLILEPLSLKFCTKEYVNWLNDIDVIRYLDSGGDYTLEKLENYIQYVNEKEIFFWAIILKKSNKHIGNIKIDPINQKHKLGEYGILMGDRNSWGKGYAKEASQKVIEYCFKNMNLRKITLGVIQNNTSAFNLYQSLGFQIEGVYKMHGIYDGKYCDAIRMALFDKKNVDVQKYFSDNI